MKTHEIEDDEGYGPAWKRAVDDDVDVQKSLNHLE
jgi:hypothetical protein